MLNSEKTQQQYTVVPIVRHEFIPAPPQHEQQFNRKSIFPPPLFSLLFPSIWNVKLT